MNKEFLLSIALVAPTILTQPVHAGPRGGMRHESFDITQITPERLLANIEPGEQVDLSHLQLEGEAGEAQLELERFDIFAANAEILVHEDSKIRRRPPRKGAYYHGRVSGHQDSLAVLSVDDNGRTQGIVQLGDRVWLLNDDRPDRRQRLNLRSRSMPEQALPGQPSEPMRCGLDTLKQTESGQQSSLVSQAMALEPLIAPLPAGQLFQATIAIETDGEFYALFGNAESATAYIANLFAYASTLYERETQTRLNLGQINLWPNAATDPWSFTSTSAGLTAFKGYWSNNKEAVPRTTAHFLSGKNLGGGIAYLNALCSNDYGYGLSASLRGDFAISNPQPLWDIFVVTHEMGHNFNSQHTHDYQNIGGDVNPIDSCPSGFLPGLSSLSGGASGAGNGTIMSYCHQLTGGYRNISLTFGQSPFAYGIKPYRVSDVMTNYVAQQAVNHPGCLPILANNYDLSATKTGSGTGTLTSSPAGLNCGSTCSASFSADTSVTLTATPDNGSTFNSWSGCDATSGTVCNVSMSATRSVTARFDAASYSLTVNKSGTGSGTVTSNPAGINCGATCVFAYASGQSVTLTPTPASGYDFSSWSGACTGSEACIVTMDAAKSVTANFTAIPTRSSVLSVTKTGLGSVTSLPVGIDCSGTCNATFTNGTSVTLTAAPVTGYYFAGWGGACSGQGTCTLTINSNQTATANFAQIPSGNPLLTITVTGGGTVATNPSGMTCSSTCSYPFPTGTAVSLIPSANTGQTFMGWTGEGCIGRSSCLITMDSPKTVGATFQNTYTLIMPAINLLLFGD
jgi:hypothetical protein